MLQELIEQINSNHSNQPFDPEELASWATHPITQYFAELIELEAIDILQDVILVESNDRMISKMQGRVIAFEHVLTQIDEFKKADDEEGGDDE